MPLVVNEIFYSIQGESLYAGRPCTFVRLTGCNLRCSYCDTAYAYGEGKPLELPELIRQVAAFQCPLVEITGGEPLLQAETPRLAAELLNRGYTVLVETNGSLDIRCLDPRCVKIMDVKCPGSGESGKMLASNLEHLCAHDQLKFVLTDRSDYEYARGLLLEKWRIRPPVEVLLSPAAGRIEPARIARWILADRLPARIQLQLHRILWPDIERGA
jgi:7-carboxy-7-deazaguanine synthase